MKVNFSKLLFLLLALPFVASFAQTENTDAFANIVNPITISETRALHFGTLSVSATAGTCVLTAAGVRSQTGGVTLTSFTPTATSAAYTVTGSANLNYAITLPAAPITVTRGGGSETMTVSTYTSNKVGNAGTLNGSATDTFTVGATLNVNASQVAGLYQGNFNVTVAYN
jgi:hypothetical protein